MKYLIAGFLFLALGSCQAPSGANRSELIGKWKLTHSLADIGDGKGTWQEASFENSRVIEFQKGGKFSDSQNQSIQTYTLSGKDTIQITRDNNQTYSVTIVKLTADSLVLKPACIEACGERYVRVK